jgi:hypothetical protein
MGWWATLSNKINVGDELFTPVEGTRGLERNHLGYYQKPLQV